MLDVCVRMILQTALAAQVMVWQDGLVEFWENAGAQARVTPKTPEVSNVPYRIIYFHPVDPYRIPKSIWIWK